MRFEHGTTAEIERFFNDTGTYMENGYEYHSGFDLMTPYFFLDAGNKGSAEFGCHYLLYLNEKEEVVGVLKWKRYGIPDHQFVPEEESGDVDSYVAIRFIDVKRSERNEGVALKMVSHWSNKYLYPDDRVVGGKATPVGRSTDIHRWMGRELQQKYYIDEEDLIEEWEEGNDVYWW